MVTSSIPKEVPDSAIRAAISDGYPFIISIDGLAGVGKSTLAQAIIAKYGGSILSFDDYLEPHRGTYLPHLQYPALAKDLAKAMTSPQVIILEGLCALSVLEELVVVPEFSIYIRRVNEYGRWIDEFYYSEDNDLADVLHRLDRIESRHPDKPGIANSDRELVRYHIKKKPITNAHFVFDQHIQSR